MKICQVSVNEAAGFSETLRHLIKSTIRLPNDAIEHFTNQWTGEKIVNCIDSWMFLIAKENDRIEGLVLGTPVEGGVGTIIWLLVDSSKQKKGLGTLLFKEACKVYKSNGAHKIKLTVPDERTTDFYLKQGMILEGVHKHHWWKNDFWAMGIQL